MPILSNPRHELGEELDRETLVAEMSRRIEAMHVAARSNGIREPLTVFVPTPLFNALRGSDRSLPYDIQPIQSYKPKKSKHRHGRR